MPTTPQSRRLSPTDIEAILSVTRALAAPFDLHVMLAQVAAEAAAVLRAERASVWLHDAERNEIHIEFASDVGAVRLPVGTGLAGQCARDRVIINVPDCYADPRFNRAIDLETGFRSRCCLTVPLIDHLGQLVGVLQALNKSRGVFDAADESLAEAVAAQCAMALSRARMTDELLAAQRLQQEMALASAVQRSTLPGQMPRLPGYDMDAVFKPASMTGGDTFDVAPVSQGLLILLADATGHGLAPALTVTRMHAMLRMALRMEADLETAYGHVNDLLVSERDESPFVTACIALLEPALHRLRFLSAGQGPILHYVAAEGQCRRYGPNGLPLGAVAAAALRPTVSLQMAPGDWFVLLSDGVFECASPLGELLGRERVEQVVRDGAGEAPAAMVERLLAAVAQHRGGLPQDDDITMVVLKRLPAD